MEENIVLSFAVFVDRSGVQFRHRLAARVSAPLDDRSGFRELLRMTSEEFEILLGREEPLITRQDTKMRRAITAREKLSLTLRLLATVCGGRGVSSENRPDETLAIQAAGPQLPALMATHAFGILANRFRVFRSTILLHPKSVTKITLASACLHNFLCDCHSEAYMTPALTDWEDADHRVNEGHGGEMVWGPCNVCQLKGQATLPLLLNSNATS
ncbi:unnamed protein product [Leuciscus chuanchicus]